MKDLFQILGVMAALCAGAWLWLKAKLFLYMQRPGVRYAPRTEIQNLFHGNTKDDPYQL